MKQNTRGADKKNKK